MACCRSGRLMPDGGALLGAALLVALASGAAAQTPMELLPLTGDNRSSAAAINTRGAVAGTSTNANGTTTAVVWDRQGRTKVLLPLEGDTDSSAAAINARGEVAGTSIDARGVSTAVVWDSQGRATALRPLGGDTDSSADAINSRGEVTGTSTDAGGLLTAVLWNRKGMPIVQPPLAGKRQSSAFALNARGEVLGSSGGTPVVWRKGSSAPQQDRSASGIGSRIPPNQLIGRIEERAPAPTLPPTNSLRLGGGGVSVIVVE